jgi:hypothetical protein
LARLAGVKRKRGAGSGGERKEERRKLHEGVDKWFYDGGRAG